MAHGVNNMPIFFSMSRLNNFYIAYYPKIMQFDTYIYSAIEKKSTIKSQSEAPTASKPRHINKACLWQDIVLAQFITSGFVVRFKFKGRVANSHPTNFISLNCICSLLNPTDCLKSAHTWYNFNILCIHYIYCSKETIARIHLQTVV